jgi:UDP-N-acetylmuramyl pentapeptide phosphotransferase/UDP-N-acetylglucosamine-1-phosphate transferase
MEGKSTVVTKHASWGFRWRLNGIRKRVIVIVRMMVARRRRIRLIDRGGLAIVPGLVMGVFFFQNTNEFLRTSEFLWIGFSYILAMPNVGFSEVILRLRERQCDNSLELNI